MSHLPQARSALAALVTAASALAAFVAPAAAAGQTHNGHHSRHHVHQLAHQLSHQQVQLAHHPIHHRTQMRRHHHYGLPSGQFILRNRATGSCLTAETRSRYTVYALAECARHNKEALWMVDRASGTLRNMATQRCVVPGYAMDFSCARLAEYGRGYAVRKDAAGRISYRSITGERYLNITRRMSGGFVFGATYTMEPRDSAMGMQQRWTTPMI